MQGWNFFLCPLFQAKTLNSCPWIYVDSGILVRFLYIAHLQYYLEMQRVLNFNSLWKILIILISPFQSFSCCSKKLLILIGKHQIWKKNAIYITLKSIQDLFSSKFCYFLWLTGNLYLSNVAYCKNSSR